MRGRFDHDPNMIRPWNCKPEPVRSQSLLFLPRQRILYWKLQRFALRLSTQISPNTAPATKRDTPRSPNAAPATKSDTPRSSWLSPRHIWNVSYNARSNRTPPSNVTKYRACHSKWLSWVLSVTFETSFTTRGAIGLILQRHQILHLPRKMALMSDGPSHMKRHLQCAKQQASPSNLTKCWCLPRKVTLMIDPRHIWNVIYNAQSNRTHPPTWPNTAPATQNDPHEWCPSHMKRHLQCAEQQDSSSNVTKYCTCHAKWLSWAMSVTYETWFTVRRATSITFQRHQILRLPRKIAFQNLREIVRKQLQCHLQCATDSTMIRAWSEHELVISHPPVRRAYFSLSRDAFCIENYRISRSGYLPRFHQILPLPRKVTLRHHQILRLPRKVTLQDHQILRLPRKVTLQDHQILRLPRKMSLMIDPRLIWNVSYNARSNRTPPPTSPSTVPATQNDSHEWCPSHLKRHLHCAEQQDSCSNVTKYCACHAKWPSWVMSVTFETSFTWRGATGLMLQRHQILHLPRKMTLMSDVRHIWNVIYNARSSMVCGLSGNPVSSGRLTGRSRDVVSTWMEDGLKFVHTLWKFNIQFGKFAPLPWDLDTGWEFERNLGRIGTPSGSGFVLFM